MIDRRLCLWQPCGIFLCARFIRNCHRLVFQFIRLHYPFNNSSSSMADFICEIISTAFLPWSRKGVNARALLFIAPEKSHMSCENWPLRIARLTFGMLYGRYREKLWKQFRSGWDSEQLSFSFWPKMFNITNNVQNVWIEDLSADTTSTTNIQ